MKKIIYIIFTFPLLSILTKMEDRECGEWFLLVQTNKWEEKEFMQLVGWKRQT